MENCGSNCPYQVCVRGLTKGDVQWEVLDDGSGMYDVEMAIGNFFYDNGCAVSDVRVMVERRQNRSDLCRGFAFVDFEDEESLQKALKLDCMLFHEKDLLDKHGKLRVELPKASSTSSSAPPPQPPLPANPAEEQRRLREEQTRTANKEKELQNTIYIANELIAQHHRHVLRQKAFESSSAFKEAFEQEQSMQKQLQQQIDEMKKVLVYWSEREREESLRAQKLEQLANKYGLDVVAAEDAEKSAVVASAVLGNNAISQADALIRASSVGSWSAPLPSPKVDAAWPEIEEGLIGAWSGGSIDGLTLTWNNGTQCAMSMITPTVFTVTLHGILVVAMLKKDWSLHWSDGDIWKKASSPNETPKVSPLVRSQSTQSKASQLSQTASEWKKNSRSEEIEREKTKAHARVVGLTNQTRWGDIYDDDDEWEKEEESLAETTAGEEDDSPEEPQELPLECKVEISNLPSFSAIELDNELRKVVSHFFEMRKAPGGEIVGVEVEIDETDEDPSSFLAVLKGKAKKSNKAILCFRRGGDACWFAKFADRKIQLGGFILKVRSEAEKKAMNDIILVDPDKDEGSVISGVTGRSGSTTANFENSGNRAVLLQNISKDVKDYDVTKDILSFLAREYWNARKMKFDEKHHLYRGSIQEALHIRTQGKSRQDEHNGSAVLRFRYPQHAEWLVQKKKVPLCGSSVTVKWAESRDVPKVIDAKAFFSGCRVRSKSDIIFRDKLAVKTGTGGKILPPDEECRKEDLVRVQWDRREDGSTNVMKMDWRQLDNEAHKSGKDGKGSSSKGEKGKKGKAILSRALADRVSDLGLDLSADAQSRLASMVQWKAHEILDVIDEKLKRGEQILNHSGYVISSVNRAIEEERKKEEGKGGDGKQGKNSKR